jgi:hypothetical protein
MSAVGMPSVVIGPAVRLLLRDSGSGSHSFAADELTDPDFHYVAAAQLAIDGKVEQRPVAQTPFSVEPEPDGPDLLRLESAFRADHASGVPRPSLPDRRVELRTSHLVLLLAGLAMERIRFSSSGKGGARHCRLRGMVCSQSGSGRGS